MRIIALALCLAALSTRPLLAQQFVTGLYLSQSGNCGLGPAAVPFSRDLALCVSSADIGKAGILQANVDSINTLNGKIRELTARNELLEKNLNTLSDAVDARTARINRGDGK